MLDSELNHKINTLSIACPEGSIFFAWGIKHFSTMALMACTEQLKPRTHLSQHWERADIGQTVTKTHKKMTAHIPETHNIQRGYMKETVPTRKLMGKHTAQQEVVRQIWKKALPKRNVNGKTMKIHGWKAKSLKQNQSPIGRPSQKQPKSWRRINTQVLPNWKSWGKIDAQVLPRWKSEATSMPKCYPMWEHEAESMPKHCPGESHKAKSIPQRGLCLHTRNPGGRKSTTYTIAWCQN